MLTHERLKEVLNYDSETGIFSWKRKITNIKDQTTAGALHNKGYIQITIDKKNYLAHRVAWFYVYGKWPQKQIDHINRIKTDNRIKNLRDVTNSTNQHNNGARRHNTSGVNGVINLKSRNCWVAQIYVDNKRIYLGTFKDKDKAISARKKYEESIQKDL